MALSCCSFWFATKSISLLLHQYETVHSITIIIIDQITGSIRFHVKTNVTSWRSNLGKVIYSHVQRISSIIWGRALQSIPWRLRSQLVDRMKKVLVAKGILQLKEFIRRGSKNPEPRHTSTALTLSRLFNSFKTKYAY